MTAQWGPADYLRDIGAQADEANAAWRDEVRSQRIGDYVHDDRPNRRELDAEDRR